MAWSPAYSISNRSGSSNVKQRAKINDFSETGTVRRPGIWKSQISWRIALTAFLTILVVQAAILLATFETRKQALLHENWQAGRAVVSAAIGKGPYDELFSPITQEAVDNIFSGPLIRGVSVYSMDMKLIASYGVPVALRLSIDPEAMIPPVYDAVNMIMEAAYAPADLGKPYFVTVQMETKRVGPALVDYVNETLVIMLLMSAFVTVVLMISLSRWLLEPMLFMRGNLLSATEQPENPDVPASPYNQDDEIGTTIMLMQNLIRQNAQNMTQIKSAAEDKIHKLAYYDTLTGLPNRTLFLQKLTEQARKAHNDDDSHVKRFAVIALDLDHFKDINDSMGHNVGDAILRGVGKRLRAALPDSAVVARSGEDEFAITTPLMADGNARDVADKIASVIRHEPFKVFNEAFQVRSSIGVSTFPDDGIDPDQVLKNADIALNRAKEDGRDRIKEYSEDFDRAVQQRFQLLRDLRDAMEHKELMLYFQPQFDLNNGKIIGAEALLRWFKKDSSKGGGQFISPAEFIPVAEQSGLIVPIGDWVIQHACEVAATWQRAGRNIRVAVNVSGAQFYQSDLVATVAKSLAETGLRPESLELEVTESVFMENIEHTIETLQQLHALGVELAIDDFGTGYSSLSYLRQFPIDRLKIDQSFIRNALNNNDDAAIARTIVRLAHSLNLKVIAEGVETKEHEAFLMEEKCDEVQGFRYSKAIPADEFDKFIMGYKGKLSSFDKKN